MSSASGPHSLRSRKTRPKGLINHFNSTDVVEARDQAKEYDDFKRVIRAVKARKGSRVARITPPLPQAAHSDKLPPTPQLQDSFHIVVPLSDVRSQLLNLKAISDDDAFWETLNIPAFNQGHARLSEPIIRPTSQPTRKGNFSKTLAVANLNYSQPRRRARTPATTKPSPLPSPSSSELSSVSESILADTPEAFQDTASTAINSSLRAEPYTCRRRPRKSKGPRLGFFVKPRNAEPPLFDYCAAVCQLRKYNLQIKREVTTRRQLSEQRTAILKSIKDIYKLRDEATRQTLGHADKISYQAHDRAKALRVEGADHDNNKDEDTSYPHKRTTAQVTGLEDEEEPSSDGDPMDLVTPSPYTPFRRSQPTRQRAKSITSADSPTREGVHKTMPVSRASRYLAHSSEEGNGVEQPGVDTNNGP